VIVVTEKTWQSTVIDNPLPVFVKFYAPWCGHCKSLAPVWEQAATNLKGVVPIVKVDCTSEQALCNRYSVKGYPTLKVFKNKKDVDYNGGRDAKSIVSFATSQIKNSVHKITSEEALNSFLKTLPDVPHLLLFSEKEASTLYQALSMKYDGRLVLAHVKSTLEAIVSKYGVDTFPRLVTIQGDKVTTVEGELGKDGLVKVAEQLAAGVEPHIPQAEPEAPKPIRKKPVEAKTAIELTADNLQSTCSEKKICVLGFVSSDEDKKLFSDVTARYGKDSKFSNFAWTSCEGETKSVCTKFGISSLPSLVVYRPTQKKVASAAAFTDDEISAVLNRALGGDLKWSTKQDL